MEWGLKETEGGLIPVRTDLLPAPEELLQIITCNCQTDCSSMRCTYEKHNVKCSPACGNCRGSGCINSDKLELEFDEVTVLMKMTTLIEQITKEFYANC